MESFASKVIIFSAIIFTFIILIEWIRSREIKILLLQFILLIILIAIISIITSFPSTDDRVALGNDSIIIKPWLTVVSMYFFIIFGMISNYFFHFKAKSDFKLIKFLKPIFISPIILLPLIGVMQEGKIELMQYVSFLLLSFQNGFFWKEIFNRTKSSMN